jgi:hypothetical protein
VKRDFWASSYIEALKVVHFEECDGPDPEDGYEKIAVFQKGGLFKHVALIASPETWKSKLGEYEDLDHPHDGMDGGKYGNICKYLRRSVAYAGGPMPEQYRI